MDLIQAMGERRSIRRYEDRPVDDETVEKLLRAAMSAPSAGNQQPWRFVVVRDAELKRALADCSPYASMLPSASVGIVVCGDRSVERHAGFWVQDCAAATENLLLAAHALGLGAVWLGFHPVAERERCAAALLKLPESVVPLAVVPVGWPAEPLPPVDRFDPTFVHRDLW